MARADGSLGSLVQGVSQQPARARLPGQAEEQINVTNDEVFGLSRRPATTYEGSLPHFSGAPRKQFQAGTLDVGGKHLPYIMRLQPESGTVEPEMYISEDGFLKNVILDGNYPRFYLQGNNPQRYVFKEIGDTVFVLNPEAEPLMWANDFPPGLSNKTTVVYARGAQYATGFSVRLEITSGGSTTRHVVTYATPDGSAAAHTEQAQVKYILRQLYELARGDISAGSTQNADDFGFVPDPGNTYASTGADVGFNTYMNMYLIGDHLLFVPKSSSTDYRIVATDTSGSELMIGVYDEVDDVGLLPNRASVGQVVKVAGSNRADDDFYLQWQVEGFGNGARPDVKGSWEEVSAPDQEYRIAELSMPQRLYKDGSGDWHIGVIDWKDRGAGDDNSNPPPAFIGTPIADIADFQGRAVFLHGSEVSMSKSNDYFDWFRQTASTKLDTDPINLRSTSTKGASTLTYAVPFNRDLILFGTDDAQFIIPGRNTVTSATAAMTLTAEFDVDLSVRPQPIGESILFASHTGKFTHMHEMYLTGNADRHERRTLTDHVPRYIPGKPVLFTADDGTNTAFVVTDDDPRTMYVYEYLWIDNRRVQSAWNKWTFPMEITSIRVEDGELLYTFQGQADGHVLAKSLLYRQDYEDLDFPLHLDAIRQAIPSGGDILVPFSGRDEDLADLRVVQLDGPLVDGDLLPITSAVRETVNVPNHIDYARITLAAAGADATLVAVGQKFDTKLVPTMPTVKDGDGVTISGAEISVSHFTMTFTDTGPFSMTRECQYEATEDYWTLEYSGRKLGDPGFVLGQAPVDSDNVIFPFEDQTTTSSLVITCDSHLPMTLTEIEWDGNVRNRTRRITNGG